MLLKFPAANTFRQFQRREFVRLRLAVRFLSAATAPVRPYGRIRTLETCLKGVPQDRHQRLYVLSLRENRVNGRLRKCFLIPTEIMGADALTKKMISRQLMNLLTSGYRTGGFFFTN